VPHRFLLSYDKPKQYGAAHSHLKMMNGITLGQVGPKCDERLKAITFFEVVAFCVSSQDKEEAMNL